MKSNEVVVGGTLSSATVRGAVRPQIERVAEFTGQVTRVSVMTLPDDSAFPIHFGGPTGLMHKKLAEGATWAENVTVVQVFKPVDPNVAMLQQLLQAKK